MQRFRQPQKMQGPLFPIEDSELIDAINDFKNIPNKNINVTECKTESLLNEFDAANHIEVIEVNDINMDSYDDDFIAENETSNDKDDKENFSKYITKDTERTVNMFCKLNIFLV